MAKETEDDERITAEVGRIWDEWQTADVTTGEPENETKEVCMDDSSSQVFTVPSPNRKRSLTMSTDGTTQDFTLNSGSQACNWSPLLSYEYSLSSSSNGIVGTGSFIWDERLLEENSRVAETKQQDAGLNMKESAAVDDSRDYEHTIDPRLLANGA